MTMPDRDSGEDRKNAVVNRSRIGWRCVLLQADAEFCSLTATNYQRVDAVPQAVGGGTKSY